MASASLDTAVFDYLATHRQRHLAALIDLVRQPSISTDPARRDDLRACAAWLADYLRGIGLPEVTVEETGGHPVVVGAWRGAPARPTVLIYGHYDVQPADPLALWHTPPFAPTVRDGRLYGRGTTDDKGQFFAHVNAVEALLAVTGRLPVNVVFLLEGEEEVGSEHLPAFIAANRARLAADVALISDSPMLGPGQPSLCYGVRGLAYLEVTVTTAARDLHSGQYGGVVPNPILALAAMLTACKDAAGRVIVPGFYDEVLPLAETERASLAALPFDEAALARDLGLSALPGEPGYSVLERLGARPTFDAHGIWGGYSGAGSKTVIPNQASAKISSRLVPNQRPAVIAERITAHLRAVCPPGASVAVSELASCDAALTPLDHPATRAAARALQAGFGAPPVFTREGGSLPVIALFQDLLGLPTVLVGFGLPDEPLHAPNECFDLDNYYNGGRTIAALLTELATLREA